MLHIPQAPIGSQEAPFTFAGVQKIAAQDWIAVADNPVQRDTAHRAKASQHLKVFDDTHRRVALAILPNGKTFKVDGHTRAYMWANNLTEGLPSPLFVDADVYRCRDREAAIELYIRFDSRLAAETPQDQIFGAQREVDLSFTSPMLRTGRYGTPIKRLYQRLFGLWSARHSDPKFTYQVVEFFKPELLMFDRTQPLHTDYNSHFIAAAILTFMRHGEEAAEFWQKYGRNEGVKIDAQSDGVQALRNLLSHVRVAKKQSSQHTDEIVGRALNAYEMYRAKKYYTGKGGIPHSKKQAEYERFYDMARKAKEARRP